MRFAGLQKELLGRMMRIVSISEPRHMGEQMKDGHWRILIDVLSDAIRHMAKNFHLADAGDVPEDGVVQLHAPFIVQHHNCGAEHRLSHAVDAEKRVRFQRAARGNIYLPCTL